MKTLTNIQLRSHSRRLSSLLLDSDIGMLKES